MLKVTHSEKVPSNKTPALMKSMNMDISIVGTSNQLFVRAFYTKQNFQEDSVVTGKLAVLCNTSVLYSSLYLP